MRVSMNKSIYYLAINLGSKLGQAMIYPNFDKNMIVEFLQPLLIDSFDHIGKIN